MYRSVFIMNGCILNYSIISFSISRRNRIVFCFAAEFFPGGPEMPDESSVPINHFTGNQMHQPVETYAAVYTLDSVLR